MHFRDHEYHIILQGKNMKWTMYQSEVGSDISCKHISLHQWATAPSLFSLWVVLGELSLPLAVD